MSCPYQASVRCPLSIYGQWPMSSSIYGQCPMSPVHIRQVAGCPYMDSTARHDTSTATVRTLSMISADVSRACDVTSTCHRPAISDRPGRLSAQLCGHTSQHITLTVIRVLIVRPDLINITAAGSLDPRGDTYTSSAETGCTDLRRLNPGPLVFLNAHMH